MTMFATSFREDATYKPAGPKSRSGLPKYDTEIPVKVRWEPRVQRVRSDDGEEFVSRGRIFAPFQIKSGDRIASSRFGEWEIRAAVPLIRANGKVAFWKGWV